MRIVVQRALSASVEVDGEIVGKIGRGLVALVGAEQGDSDADIEFIAKKLVGMRIFEDADDKMNLSVKDVGGEALLVSQFTLLGDARHGRRPSFSRAAPPEIAEPLCEKLRDLIAAEGVRVETGRFRAHMLVSLVNDGPVTIILDSRKLF